MIATHDCSVAGSTLKGLKTYRLILVLRGAEECDEYLAKCNLFLRGVPGSIA